jgi:hypothetical protein
VRAGNRVIADNTADVHVLAEKDGRLIHTGPGGGCTVGDAYFAMSVDESPRLLRTDLSTGVTTKILELPELRRAERTTYTSRACAAYRGNLILLANGEDNYQFSDLRLLKIDLTARKVAWTYRAVRWRFDTHPRLGEIEAPDAMPIAGQLPRYLTLMLSSDRGDKQKLVVLDLEIGSTVRETMPLAIEAPSALRQGDTTYVSFVRDHKRLLLAIAGATGDVTHAVLLPARVSHELSPHHLGKTHLWVIAEAEPGAPVWVMLNRSSFQPTNESPIAIQRADDVVRRLWLRR